MTLNWLTDPELLDTSPSSFNQWQTANSLMENRSSKIIHHQDGSFTNLYGILVRKVDFVRKKKRDRILARFPFLVLTDKMIEELQAKELLLAEAIRDYFYRSINKSVLAWRDRINNFFDRGAIPLPLYRVAEDMQLRIAVPPLQEHPLSLFTDQIPFTSARGEPFSIPKKISKKLAYLLGVIMGDGNLRKYWIIVVDETKKHILFINELFEELFGKSGKMIKMGGAWATKLNLLWAVRLFNFLSDQPINEPKYDSLREPLILKQLGEPFRAIYWRGAFDADGSYKNRLSFSSTSRSFSIDFQKFLAEIGIENKLVEKENNAYQIEIPAAFKWKFAKIIGCLHIKKMEDCFSLLGCSSEVKIFRGFNKSHLTQDGQFFNFSLLPHLIVIGLFDYLERRIFSEYPKESYWLYKNKGITIKKLEYLTDKIRGQRKSIMNILYDYKDSILFRSANSQSIKLPLKPSNALKDTMEQLIPTTRGATLRAKNESVKETIEQMFQVKIKGKKIAHRLLSKYLTFFGEYELDESTQLTKKKISKFKEKWRREIDP